MTAYCLSMSAQNTLSHYPGASGHFDSVIGATAEFLIDRLAPR